MTKIKNYIKDGDNFIPVEDFTGTVPDPEYIDSAMELTINGTPIITCAEWDYMIPLWAYIANGFEELANNSKQSEWTTGFPDQPIDLTFRLNKAQNQIEIHSTPSRGVVSATTNLDEFITVMSEAGEKFFLRMSEILPEEKNDYEWEANRMREMAIKLKQSLNEK